MPVITKVVFEEKNCLIAVAVVAFSADVLFSLLAFLSSLRLFVVFWTLFLFTGFPEDPSEVAKLSPSGVSSG